MHSRKTPRPAASRKGSKESRPRYGLSVMAQRRNVAAGDYSDDAIADADILAFMPRIRKKMAKATMRKLTTVFTNSP